MTVKTRILEAASELLGRSADADISTRAVGEAAGVTAPTLYHHFGDKEGLLTAVVDFGWAAFLESKRATAAVVHEHRGVTGYHIVRVDVGELQHAGYRERSRAARSCSPPVPR